MIRIVFGVLLMLVANAIGVGVMLAALHLVDTFPSPLKFSQSMGVGAIMLTGLLLASALTFPAVKLAASGVQKRKEARRER